MSSRREWIRVGVTATGGLLVAFRLLDATQRPRTRLAAARLAPNVFVEVDNDGLVTLTIPRPEMGQGARTAIAMLLAEEIGIAPERVRLKQADFDPAYGDQYVGGSNTVRGSWQPLRRAGAVVRTLLVQAAAASWGVPADACDAANGAVHHAVTGRSAPFATLVAAAAALPVPSAPAVRDPSRFRVIGKPQRALDVPDIVRGAVQFGLDARTPGMLVAQIERSPVFGASVGAVDDRAARAVTGVRHVVAVNPDELPEFPENSPKMPAGVAVVATDTWAAMQGRKALHVTWHGGARDESTDVSFAAWRERARQAPHFVELNYGAFDDALAGAATRHEAFYEVPYLAHAPMEPMNCLADARGDRCEVWAPTQNPEDARDIAALVAGIPKDRVTVHPMRMGGAFGRRFYSDFVAEAVYLSKRVQAPVQVVWSREDDIRHCLYRPAGVYYLSGGLDASGSVVAWYYHGVNASRGSYLRWKPQSGGELHPGEVDRTDYPAAFVPNFRMGYTEMPSAIPRGQYRAVEDSATVFAIQGFLDELAHLARRDPVDVQLELLRRDAPTGARARPFDPLRLRAVIERVADRARWGTRAGVAGRGFACAYSHGSYVAEVADVDVDANGRPRVRRVTAAVDCGTPVNPLGIEAQVMGSVIYGLSAALHQRITVRNGGVEQGNFDTFRPLRMSEAPVVDVYVMPGTAAPGGMGEGALSPVAPAVANALFAATGRRARSLPLIGS